MRTRNKQIQAQQIALTINFVCRQFKISKADLLGDRRFRTLVEARFVIAYAAQLINPEISDDTISEKLKRTRWTVWKLIKNRVGFMEYDSEYKDFIERRVQAVVNRVNEQIQHNSNCSINPVHDVTLTSFEFIQPTRTFEFIPRRHESLY